MKAENLLKEIQKHISVRGRIQDTVGGVQFLDITNGTISYNIEVWNNDTDGPSYGLSKLPAEGMGTGADEVFTSENALIEQLKEAFA